MDESNQIGERASLPHKVVHQEIALSGLHPANELGLMSQTLITTGSSMPYRISLNNCTTDANFLRAINPLGQGGGQGGRDFVYSLGFQRMNGYQFHGAAVKQSADPCNAVCFFERCDEPVEPREAPQGPARGQPVDRGRGWRSCGAISGAFDRVYFRRMANGAD